MKNECKTIVIDVDGVLVHSVFYSESGERFKSFNARDNRAIREMVAAGWTVVLMSQSKWGGLEHFANKVGATYFIDVVDKLKFLKMACEINEGEFFAIADDITDEPLLRAAKQAWLPRNAFHSMHGYWARYTANAGEGAVADVWAELQTMNK